MKKTLVSMLAMMVLGGFVGSLKAQTTDIKPPMNSIMSSQQQTLMDKKPSPQPEIQESNIMWKKTVIREVDFRQKINQVFYYPVNPTLM